MTPSRDPSVAECRRQSESARAALAGTVSKLRQEVSETAHDIKTRLSPSHIKKEVADYVHEGSEQLFYSIERKARQNPLQAVALGAGLAYPLWGLLKAFPVPVVFIGAGLWLSKKQKSPEYYVQDIVDKVSEKGDQLVDSIRDTRASLGEEAEAIAREVRSAARDVRDSVTNMGNVAAGAVTNSAVDARDSVLATASDLRDRSAEFGNRSRSAFENLVDSSPLLVAGLGLAIGAFIAGSLPNSDMENRLFGETSDELKAKGLRTASRSVEHAKDVAAGVVGDVAAAAAREGLSLEGVANAVDGVTESVKAVVDKGLKTALREENVLSQSQRDSNQ